LSRTERTPKVWTSSQLIRCNGAWAGMGRDGMEIARRCERAVVTAYRDLRQIGTDDMAAFQACTTLYRIHHPEASINEARRLVAEWIDHHVIRGDRGPTPGCDCA
jgi:hypothetical protein